jgi:hypothetical protein
MRPRHLRFSVEKDTLCYEVWYLFISEGFHDIEQILEWALERDWIKEGDENGCILRLRLDIDCLGSPAAYGAVFPKICYTESPIVMKIPTARFGHLKEC